MAIVLLSGGLDSAFNLAWAASNGEAKLAITIRYGQRAEAAEIYSSEQLCLHYGVPWLAVDVSWLGKVNPSSLTSVEKKIPSFQPEDLDVSELTQKSMKAVWVANRNGVFLNIAAAYAEALDQTRVLVGFNREEAATFPDNSSEYIGAMNHALSFSTLNGVKVDSCTTDWDKVRIVEEALKIGLPLNLVWSCYEAGPDRCWSCESCRRSERALLAAGMAGKNWLQRLGNK